MQPAQITTYDLIQKIISDDYQEDFVNCFFDFHCRPECGVECNDHYIEGPEIKDILGCCIMHFEKEESFINFVQIIIDKVDDGYAWEGDIGWKKL